MDNTTLVAIFSVGMFIGLIGVLIPVLPGIPFMFLLALVYGFIDRFAHLVWWELVLLLVVALLSFVVDYSSGMIGARYGGASRRSALAGMLGLIVGLIVFPPFGGLIGLFVGVLVAELLGHKERIAALKAATGSLLGSVAGIIVNALLGILFIILFIVFALR